MKDAPKIAISTGDPGGIGPEIALKAARDPRVLAVCEPVLVGPRDAAGFHLGQIHPDNGRAAIESARAAIRGALAGEYAAVVAAPHSEQAIHAAGIEFDGYPSFVARETGLPPEHGVLMLCFRHAGRELRIAHVTLHSSVADALRRITPESVGRTLRAVHGALQRIGIRRPRIAVSGVNPHAGEGGLFGREEETAVTPAIAAARAEGIGAAGPVGADTLFHRPCDAYVVMFHDQGHIAAKLLAPNRAAGLTIGTPVIFSSVGHGAAFDIAGKNRADPGAMIEAVTRLVARRRRVAATGKKA